MLVYVAVSQLSYLVVTRLAAGPVAFTVYTNAYQLFQLPHAIIAVSVITALLPRMSAHAADRRLDLVRDDLSTGLRMSTVVLVPAALGLLALAQPLSISLFAWHSTSVAGASRIGGALAAFAVALLPFSAFQLQLRGFYAMADSRTPALVMCAVASVNISSALILSGGHPQPRPSRRPGPGLCTVLRGRSRNLLPTAAGPTPRRGRAAGHPDRRSRRRTGGPCRSAGVRHLRGDRLAAGATDSQAVWSVSFSE